ncbi:MAG: 2-phosphosulfolactate phosphatase [Synergistaceae bacterium]|jgi:2-phosphosulfolactate phosphatase|nr:2-phosphosulfolactate phosphatase [Synergistaceae bacterium]
MSKLVQVETVFSYSEHLPVVDVWLVVDILRATTMIVTWFAAGGAELYPTVSVDAARSLAEHLKEEGGQPLLMGEQNAVAPQGFDLGNSPLGITPEMIQKYSCAVMATTNGTKAISKAASMGTPVLIACARNAFAALDLALTKGNRLGIFCSGRKGRPAWDDTLCAGLFIAILKEHFPDIRLADSSRLALLAWSEPKNFKSSLKTADHAIFLEKIGYGDDIAFAAEIDAVRVVPELHELPSGNETRLVLRPGMVPEKPLALNRQASWALKILEKNSRGGEIFSEPTALIRLLAPNRTEDDALSDFSPMAEGRHSPGNVFFGGELYRRRRRNKVKRTS